MPELFILGVRKKDERMGTALDTLNSENISSHIFAPLFGKQNKYREYDMQFRSVNFDAANGFEYPVKTIGDVHIVYVDLSFLPR
ncbi:MAG TPA: hypothetical protein VGM58_06825, partial [Verrucomicrobiae bacterium]